VAFLLADLGITQSHSRPHVCDDNPFSEAQFKTMKYRPDFPGHFPSIEAARQHCQIFFPWYNDQHRHSGLGLHTPADVHYGTATAIRAQRSIVLTAAYHAHPERFVHKPPQPPALPTGSWINPPKPERRHRSVNTAQRCLIQVDRFRSLAAGLADCESNQVQIKRRSLNETPTMASDNAPQDGEDPPESTSDNKQLPCSSRRRSPTPCRVPTR
jgi:hypothetical protein